jgi:FG-GAP repeat
LIRDAIQIWQLLFLVSVLLLPGPVYASNSVELVASNASSNDQFGYAVAVEGDIAVVGAPFANTGGGIDAGAVYVYRWSGGEWVEEAILTASDGSTSDRFGYAVDVSGNTVIVGAIGETPPSTLTMDTGAAYIFTWDGSSWTENTKLTIPFTGSPSNPQFGASVALSGNTAIVGAPNFDTVGRGFGRAYVYGWDGSAWNEQAVLESDRRKFGISVDLEGNTAVIGTAEGLTLGGFILSSSAHVYELVGAAWSLQAVLIPNDFVVGGRSTRPTKVAISNESVIVTGDGRGSLEATRFAYVFTRSGTTWSEQGQLSAGNIQPFAHLISASISGDLAMVGVPQTFNESPDNGSVFIFRRDGTTWNQIARRFHQNPAPDDQFGFAVTVSGSRAIVGAPLKNLLGGGSDQGAATIVEDCVIDINNNFMVDGAELGFVLGNWGQSGITDLNGDGTTDGADLGIILGSWGACF